MSMGIFKTVCEVLERKAQPARVSELECYLFHLRTPLKNRS
jgi:hypothetical protein